MPCPQSSGVRSFCHASWLSRNSLSHLCMSFSSSYGMPSGPVLFLFGVWLMAWFISCCVKGLFVFVGGVLNGFCGVGSFIGLCSLEVFFFD